MEDKLQPFRHPMVTASGIILGFTLRFTQGWASEAFGVNRLFDIEIFISLCICITLSTIVIYRIMTRDYPREEVVMDRYYKKTLKLFILAILMPFIAIFIIVAEKIIFFE